MRPSSRLQLRVHHPHNPAALPPVSDAAPIYMLGQKCVRDTQRNDCAKRGREGKKDCAQLYRSLCQIRALPTTNIATVCRDETQTMLNPACSHPPALLT